MNLAVVAAPHLGVISDLEIRITASVVGWLLILAGWLGHKQMAYMILIALAASLGVLLWGRFVQWWQLENDDA